MHQQSNTVNTEPSFACALACYSAKRESKDEQDWCWFSNVSVCERSKTWAK